MGSKSTPRRGKSTADAADAGGLTPKQARFAAEYLKDFNALQAAIRAGYSAKTAGQAGYRLLKHVQVQQMIAPKRDEAVAERAEAINRMALSAERTRLEIARLSYFDPRKLFRANGEPVPVHELDDDSAACIAGLEVLEQYEGSGKDRVFVGYLKKYKIADKNAALEKAAKIDGLYEKDNKQKSSYEDALRALAESKTAASA